MSRQRGDVRWCATGSSTSEAARAEAELRAWADGGGESMTMYLLAVDGVR